MEPYRGLQPYTEENEDIFFGRDSEKAILIDKILSHKLTLLFAATGVGKSSLLQAAVIPDLKRPTQENLDVVYYKDWVSSPLSGLKKSTLRLLIERSKVASEYSIPANHSLKEFLQICTMFSSEPLVIILDQFEEFFQYHRYSKDFYPFIKQLSESIRDREMSAVFLISMREDFALNLSLFKDYLPTTLFENYYRLEKLKKDKAKEAINLPVQRVGFSYEKGLLEELLNDLTDRERESRVSGSKLEMLPGPSYVEPPYVQIVCKQLWDAEKHNPDRIIRRGTYGAKGKAQGFVDSYFGELMKSFTPLEKKLASSAFNHLITPHGTKMAYPIKELSQLLRVDEKDLGNVLEKLHKARVLRSQSREGVIWYELYHDIFSNIVHKWNEDYKAKQRTKRAFFISGSIVLFLFIVFAAYDIFINLTSYHLRISAKRISNKVELYSGKAGSLDILNLQAYEAETVYSRNQIEPDKQFAEKNLTEYDKLNRELIGQLPIVERISAYWETGMVETALDLAEKSISNEDMRRTREVIRALARFRTPRAFEILNKHLDPSEDDEIRTEVVSSISSTKSPLLSEVLIALARDKNSNVRSNVARALGNLGKDEAVDQLIVLLDDQEEDVRRYAASALGELGANQAVVPLIELLKDQGLWVRIYSAQALAKIGKSEAVGPMVELLKDQDEYVRRQVFDALTELGIGKAVGPLLGLLKNKNYEVQWVAATLLSEVGDRKTVRPLVEFLHHPNRNIRTNAARALGQPGRVEAIEPLVESLLYDSWSLVRAYAAESLGRIGSDDAVGPLIRSLDESLQRQYRFPFIRQNVAKALGEIGKATASETLLQLLNDEDDGVRVNAVLALGKIGKSEVADQLLKLLKDENWDVKESAALALGNIGRTEAIVPLVQVLSALQRYDAKYTNAMDVLSKFDKRNLTTSFVALLKDPNSDIRDRHNAVNLIGRWGNTTAVAPLLDLLGDQNPLMQARVADALGNLGDVQAVGALSELLRDSYPLVRASAALP